MSELNKTIAISDIHISNGAKYSWFLPPYPECLAKMLNKMASDAGIDELVLMGDLFDLWLYPINIVPWEVKDILDANVDVADALRNCVGNINTVYYMNGNHDMAVQEDDLKLLDSGGKSIIPITTGQYSQKHQGKRHLEHGHAVDMFNAPDDSGDTIGGYPLGFFITRLVATADDQNAVRRPLRELLESHAAKCTALGAEAVDAASVGSLFVEELINLLEKHANVKDNDEILLSKHDTCTVGDIKKHYGSLLSTWMRKYPDPEDFTSAMLVSVKPNGLSWYAKKLLSKDPTPSVVVMGHTHYAVSENQYDNDGCWCIHYALGGGSYSYYVEIEDTASLETKHCNS